MSYTRREMLKLGAGAAALCATGIGLRPAAAKPATHTKKVPIALQLYSVRGDCAKDLAGVLEAVAKMGYVGVEFAGYYGHDPKEIRKMLDRNGLKCCGTHTGLGALLGDNLKGTIELHKTLGAKFINVPSMGHDRLGSPEAIVKTARLFNELAEKLKPAGMRVGYHSHGGDFRQFDGRTAWDIFFSNTKPAVNMQLDIGNCIGGGGDPYAILKKFPGRAATVHIKEHGGKPGAVIGEGDVKWKEIFALCEKPGGIEWYIVEQEGYGALSPLQVVKRCLVNLRKMGK
jgi:sugar phosphate isomerase/epimerase